MGGVWFSKDRATVAQGRAAARREVNPLSVRPRSELCLNRYGTVIRCTNSRSAVPLSRMVLPDRGPVLIVYGDEESESYPACDVMDIFVDFTRSEPRPRFRHEASVMLSIVAEMLQDNRGPRG